MSGSRVTYVCLAVATIFVGLLVHFGGAVLGTTVRDVTGDALWAAMLMWWVSALAPAARRTVRGAVSYAGCVAVELSQLYRTPTLDAVRATPLGRLVLGSGFDPRDLAAYAAGVAAAMLLDVALSLPVRVSAQPECPGDPPKG